MPEIIRCPDCNKEAYAGLPACPHCSSDVWTPKPRKPEPADGDDDGGSPFMGHAAYDAARDGALDKQHGKTIMKVIAGAGVVLALVLEFGLD